MPTMIAVTRFVAPLAVSVLCTIPAAAQGFEGTIHWQMGEKGREMAQTYKGSQVRTEMTGERGRQGVMIMDASARTMTMLMPDEKMYMRMDLKDMGEMEGQDHKPPKLTPTGKTETIAGKTCEVFRYATEEGKPDTREMCVAKGMGFFMGGSRGAGPGMGMAQRNERADIAGIASNPQYAKMYKEGFFPLRISKLVNDTAKTEMVATKIEPKSVDASAFQPPADYTEMKMPGGMGMPKPRQ